jgi:hypothetical protein
MNSPSDVAAFRLPFAIGVLLALLAWEIGHPFFSGFTRGPGALRRRGINAALNLGLGAVNALIISGLFVGLWAATMAWAEAHRFGLSWWLPRRGGLEFQFAVFVVGPDVSHPALVSRSASHCLRRGRRTSHRQTIGARFD